MTDTLIPDREASRAAIPGLPLRTRLFIDGEFRDAIDGERYVSENPATGLAIVEIAQGGPADVDAAVAAARAAADSGVWARIDPAARKAILLDWADRIEADARDLGLIETLDAGKPIADTVGLDVPETATCIRWHAEAIDKLYGQVAPSPEGTVATITREPVGVVGAVIPWNYPAQMAAWKLGPALATGNTVVIKPASMTSLSLLRLAELGAEAGIPAGVLNVVTGPGDTVGEAIGRHPDVDCVAFTGSAARARSSCSETRPTWATSRPTWRSRSSGTWARTAARARASSSTDRARTRCSRPSRPSWHRGPSAIRWTRPRGSEH
jgi:gamma-glutamyl-gamma-aminobutyraldehyde dehydrogenase